MRGNANNRASQTSFDRIAATLAALVIVGLVVFLLVRNEPIADPRLFFVLRLVLSFSAAALGATIPGFIDLKWSGGGLVVRAGGALALFVLTYLYTPDLVTEKAATEAQIKQHSTGDFSPPIVGNSGTIQIQGGGGNVMSGPGGVAVGDGTAQSQQQIGQQTVTGAPGGVTAGTITGGTYNLNEPPPSKPPQ